MNEGPELHVGSFGDLFVDVQPDPEKRAAALRRWFEQLDESLLSRPRKPLWWDDEAARGRDVTLGLGHRLAAARLLAVYTERPDLDAPDRLPERLQDDVAWDTAERSGFGKSHFGQLLVPDCWLPGDFDYTFRCPGPDGEDRTFGSLQALCDQCVFLRRRSFGFDRAQLESIAAEEAPADAPFLRLALEGLARFTVQSDRARTLGVPLVLRNAGH